MVTRYIRRQFNSAIPGRPQAEVDDDPELLNSIKTKDPEATRAAMQQHIVHSGELLADHIDDRIATTRMDVQPLS